jgi:hypothetical protein
MKMSTAGHGGNVYLQDFYGSDGFFVHLSQRAIYAG